MNSLLTLYCVHKVNKKNGNNKFFKNFFTISGTRYLHYAPLGLLFPHVCCH